MRTEVRAFVSKVGNALRLQRDWYLLVIGAAVGTLTALGAIGFNTALLWVEHRSGELTEHGIPGLGGVMEGRHLWLIPVAPMIGALITGLLVHFFASAARGHGVPQVILALTKKRGVIPLRVGLTKIAASISTVGSGGSAGAEGPIIQIGSTAGSFIGQRLGVSREHMGTLVGCGAAAGIASIFNAPIAGVFFVLEILLRDFSIRTFTPIVISSVFSAATTQAILGQNEAIFQVPVELDARDLFDYPDLPGYVFLGLACGLVAVLYTHAIEKSEELFARVKVHPIIKPVIGALLLGVLGMVFVYFVHNQTTHAMRPEVFGNGYDTIEKMLNPGFFSGTDEYPRSALDAEILLLLALCAAKCLATMCTLGSGGSGGVFAPSLFIGATFGGAFGLFLQELGVMRDGSSPATFALVGMAAVMAGSTHAPLTAILMLFELTRNVYVLIPIMLAAVLATVIAQLVERDSIYTMPLRKKGIHVGTSRDLSVLRRIPVTSVRVTSLPESAVYPSDPLSRLISLHATQSIPDFVVLDADGKYQGMVTGGDLRTALVENEAIPLLLVAELLRTDLPTITHDENLDTVMDKFTASETASLPMMDRRDETRCVGLITRTDLMKRYQRALEES